MSDRELIMYVFETLEGDAEPAPISILASSLNVAVNEVPWEASEIIIKRKFMVFISPDSPEQIYLIFGPVYRNSSGNGYFHKELARLASNKIKVEGLFDFGKSGGMLKVVLGDKYPTAEFGDSSGDYGVFDPRVLMHRHQIAEALGLKLSFIFSDYVTLDE